MARMRITRTTKGTYRKSSFKKDKHGRSHCPVCGAFVSKGKKK